MTVPCLVHLWLIGPIALRRFKWIGQRPRLRREQFRAILGNAHIVFQSDTELTGYVNSGLITKDHAGLKPGQVSSNQIGPLVTIHAHAMADSMREKSIV